MRIVCVLAALAAASSLAAQNGAPVVTAKLTIGCESCDGPDQFGSILDVAVARDGGVLVAQKEPPMLRRFDAAGKVAWTSGVQGRGPGEFTLPIRAAIVNGGILVLDMTNSRITDLDETGHLRRSVPLTSFTTTVGVNARGDVAAGFDEMGRAFRVAVRPAGQQELRELVRFGGSMTNKSVALAPDGTVAVSLDGKKYEIQRFDAKGTARPPITRDIPLPRRSAQEEAEYRERRNRDLGMMVAEMKRQGLDGKIKPIELPPGERGFDPHIKVDGLRYDPSGRLWVYTMRGDESKTIFDVFAASGSYLGEVTLPMKVDSYSFGGSYLVTSGESEVGIPVVTVWAVR